MLNDQTPVEVFSDVWAWDGNSWTDVTPVGDTPGPRVGHAMVYDVSEECIIMFGGQSTDLFLLTTSLQDTWAWNGVGRIVTCGKPTGPKLARNRIRHSAKLCGSLRRP